MHRHLRSTLRLSGLAIGLAAGLALAQSPVGALAGRADPDAVAVVTNVKTGQSREVQVNSKGRYQLRNLPIGRYEVVLRHADGRLEAAKLVDVHIGITVRVP